VSTLRAQHGIKKAKDSDSTEKLFAAYLRRAEESALGGLLVEITILHPTMRRNATQVLPDAASAYKLDVDAIGLKIKQEFAAKEKAQALIHFQGNKSPGYRNCAMQAIPKVAMSFVLSNSWGVIDRLYSSGKHGVP
jgi:hypothetical protein